MKKTLSITLMISFMVILFSSLTVAQDRNVRFGKIFGKEEANQLFGNVVFSVKVKKDIIRAALSRVDKYVLFAIKGKRPLLFNSRRKPLLDDNVTLDPGEKGYVFSKEVVEEFLNSTNDSVIEIEIRGAEWGSGRRASGSLSSNAILTLSNSVSTLELSTDCPPYCVDP
jgi:hypothetical protein